MLVGRERERASIRGLIAAARVGQSAVLVLTGEAGIGKTTLLEDSAAAASGLRVLRAAGSESESEVTFGALLAVLRPALEHLDRIPAPQAQALGSALALRPGTHEDRFAVGAATLSLLSRFAEDHPLLVLLDDAHLLDLPSAHALTFAARRLTADPVVVLAGVRDGHGGPFMDGSLPQLHLEGLSTADTAALVTSVGRDLGDSAVARLRDLTGGNPLAVAELADDVDSLEPAAFGMPVAVPASLARVFARRVDRLPAPTRRALVVVAAGGGDLPLVARACRLLGHDVGVLGAAEDVGLLVVAGDDVGFRHPLMRAAVYSDAAPRLRRAAHRALAAALPEGDADRRAWHLGEAAFGPDEATARGLADVGIRADRRGAYAVAAHAFDRSARLSPHAEDRLGRLVAGAESAWRAGLAGRAVSLLDEASDLGPGPGVRARIAGLQGTVAARTGSVETARDVLMAAGTDPATDPDAATMLLAEAILSCFFLGDIATVGRATALIDAMAPRIATVRARLVGGMAGGVADVLTGRAGPERIRGALAGVQGDLPVEDAQVVPWLVIGPLFLRERGTGRDLVPTVVDGLRVRGVVTGLPYLLFHVARDQATTDRWDLAGLTYAEGIHLAREAGHDTDLAACLAGLAWLEARQGREAACRAHAEEAEVLSSARHIALFRCWSLFARGELELGSGHPERAVAKFERLEALLTTLGLGDVDLSPAPDLVDALARVGRIDDARDAAARYYARAEAKGQPWALARAARALGVVCPDEDVDDQATRAMSHHARTLDSFESARTQLAYGARLRRARRRVDARPVLRAALSTFETLGAAPWADQAVGELRATGETVNRRGARALDELTPQELQVARLLAAGRTTREAAAALFLSPKTVEYHLRHVYVKLAIGSRRELAAALHPAG